MLVVAALILLLATLGGFQLKFYLRRRKAAHMPWDELLARVEPVRIAAIEEIANNFLHPSKAQLRLEPDEMWESIGKLKGLRAMHANADAMLDMAVYASRWNQVEGRIVAEMIRRDAVRLKDAVSKIEVALFFQLGELSAPFHLQEAVTAYHLMRGRLLGLYQVAHVGLYPRLEEVL